MTKLLYNIIIWVWSLFGHKNSLSHKDGFKSESGHSLVTRTHSVTRTDSYLSLVTVCWLVHKNSLTHKNGFTSESDHSLVTGTHSVTRMGSNQNHHKDSLKGLVRGYSAFKKKTYFYFLLTSKFSNFFVFQQILIKFYLESDLILNRWFPGSFFDLSIFYTPLVPVWKIPKK